MSNIPVSPNPLHPSIPHGKRDKKTELHSFRSASPPTPTPPTTKFLLPHPPTTQIKAKTQSIDPRQPQTPTNTAPPAPTPPNNTNSNFNSNPAPQPKPTSAMGEANGSNTPMGDLSGLSATQVRPGGAPARVYLNEKIVPHLLEGMKSVAREQ